MDLWDVSIGLDDGRWKGRANWDCSRMSCERMDWSCVLKDGGERNGMSREILTCLGTDRLRNSIADLIRPITVVRAGCSMFWASLRSA